MSTTHSPMIRQDTHTRPTESNMADVNAEGSVGGLIRFLQPIGRFTTFFFQNKKAVD